ncbi:hypothetical protein FNV43_RR21644 [Rhamnella rubrinervis]|uniref:RNase H type-1 domain-containing protein n=1 Tax=Rhamnella rubrinervis TaxID=2594499 RepID=A0A8K0GQB2_9ROSA|nr:hypothetical protein FNV43_RR21644 [Rhamnella rubrinervis]
MSCSNLLISNLYEDSATPALLQYKSGAVVSMRVLDSRRCRGVPGGPHVPCIHIQGSSRGRGCSIRSERLDGGDGFARWCSDSSGVRIGTSEIAIVITQLEGLNSVQNSRHVLFACRAMVRSLGVIGVVPWACQIILVVWFPLLIGWLKVNINGAADGCPSPGGCDMCYAFESELLGAIIAIECARDFGWDHLWEENVVADALLKLVVSSFAVQWWWGLPDSYSPMHYRNVNDFENYRFRK